MKRKHLEVLVPRLLAAVALTLAVSAGAQSPSPNDPAPTGKAPQAAPRTGDDMDSTRVARHEGDMKAKCQAMMARKQEMKDKLEAMDATLDDLVAKMNAAGASRQADAMEQPLAAVINELVAQRKTMRSMMMEMQPAMTNHMMHHMHMRGTKGAIDCPMMSMKGAGGTETEEKPAEK